MWEQAANSLCKLLWAPLQRKGEEIMNLGCSSFSWQTEDGNHLLGRTYDEFGNLDRNQIVVVPRKHRFPLEIAPERGDTAEGIYAFAGMAVLGLCTPILVDGLNEKGLMGALLNYPGYAVYPTRKREGATAVHPGFFLTYLLSQCADLNEVVSKVEAIHLTDEPVYGQEMCVHYMLSDKTGEAVILEPDAGGMTVHRHSIGVLTNSPDYLWHRTNLRNYVGVTNLPKEPQHMGGYEITEFGKRLGGGFGLPGDYSSPSRFVRLAYFKHFAVQGRDELEGITKMFHLFACVDTPQGMLKADADQELYEQTLCISAMCGESLTYYFATAANRRISAISLKRAQEHTKMICFGLQEKQDIAFLN